ncbi:MAG: hypothetical protein ACI9KE_004194 [Polyangiales bacterium]|jgi:hypothetical protein
MDLLGNGLQLLGIILLFTMVATLFGFVLAMAYALHGMRVGVESDRVALVSPDAWTVTCCLVGGVQLTAALALYVDISAALFAAGVSMLMALSCRIELVVTPQGSRLSRQIFGVIRWRVWHNACTTTLHVSAHYDLLVPESVYVNVEFDSEDVLALAWITKIGFANTFERADSLSAEFNNAVRRLNEEVLL